MSKQKPGNEMARKASHDRTVLPNKASFREKAVERGFAVNTKDEDYEPDSKTASDDSEAVEGFADALNLSVATARKLLGGVGVYPSTIQNAARELECSVIELVTWTTVQLPTEDLRYYERLSLGLYIDNGRQNVGRPAWHWEHVSLKRDKVTTLASISTPRFLDLHTTSVCSETP